MLLPFIEFESVRHICRRCRKSGDSEGGLNDESCNFQKLRADLPFLRG